MLELMDTFHGTDDEWLDLMNQRCGIVGSAARVGE